MKLNTKIYHCKLIPNTNPPQYSSPIAYTTRLNYLTIQQASGYTNAMIYGSDINNTWTMIANYLSFNGTFKVGDLLYVDGAYPDNTNEQYYGEFANAIIDNVRQGNICLKIVLKKRKV